MPAVQLTVPNANEEDEDDSEHEADEKDEDESKHEEADEEDEE